MGKHKQKNVHIAVCITALITFVMMISIYARNTEATEAINREEIAHTAESPIVGLAAGFDHTVVLLEDGSVWNWGRGVEGQLGVASNVGHSQHSPVRARSFHGTSRIGFDMTEDSDLARRYPAQLFNNIIAISSHKMHNLALRCDGTVWAWGWGWEGQIGRIRVSRQRYPAPLIAPVFTTSSSIGDYNNYLRGIQAIDTGMLFSVALRDDGRVMGWGAMDSRNVTGQPPIRGQDPAIISGLENIVAISAGNEHLLALDSYGNLWGLGQNNRGQIGDGTTEYALVPTKIELPEGIAIYQIEAGGTHSSFLTYDGYVYTWGRNDNGQLGFYSEAELILTPTRVEGIDRIVKLAANRDHTLALREDGVIWAWGWNRDGQLGNGTRANSYIPVQVHNISNARLIAAGDGHSAAVLADGRIMTWGRNWDGQLGNANPGSTLVPLQVEALNNIQSVQAGNTFSLAVHEDGTVSGWGRNNHHQLIASSTTDQRTPIRAQNARDGWEYGFAMEDNINILNNVLQIAPSAAANYTHVLAIRDVGSPEGGTVYSWGWNLFGQGGIGRKNRVGIVINDIRIDIPRRVRPVAPDWVPVQSPGGPNYSLLSEPYDPDDEFDDVISVSAGQYHSMALRSDGTVWTWGRNIERQLGGLYGPVGLTARDRYRLRPRQVPGVYNVIAIEAGRLHSVALDEAGYVWTWGHNSDNQLGRAGNVGTPTIVPGVYNIVAIAARGDFTMALDANGNVWGWGRDEGRIGHDLRPASRMTEPVLVLTENGEPLSDIIKIEAGANHSIAMARDGSLWSWGLNAHGQVGSGATSTREARAVRVSVQGDIRYIKSITLGNNYTTVVDVNGNVWSWGSNLAGALGVGSIPGDNSYSLTPVAVRSGNSDFSVLTESAYIPMRKRFPPDIQEPTPTPPAATPTPPPTNIPGDVDDNGYVTAADVGILRAYLAGFPVTINYANADVNADGAVTAADVGLIRAYLAGFPVELKSSINAGNVNVLSAFVGLQDYPISVSASHETVTPGDYINISISIDKNAGITLLNLNVSYDTSVLERVSITPANLMLMPLHPPSGGNPFRLNFELGEPFDITANIGLLATVQFRVLNNAMPGPSPINIAVASAYTAAGFAFDSICVSVAHGSVTVVAVERHCHLY